MTITFGVLRAAFLCWLPTASAVFQLIGTALIVWGLTLKPSESASESSFDRDAARAAGQNLGSLLKANRERAFAVIEHHQPRLLAWGKWLLLAGLALAVVVTVVK